MLALITPPEAAQWLRARVTGTLRADSRQVQPGDGFMAWPGAATDARQHVAQALARGATACLVERAGVDAYAFTDPAVASFDRLKAAIGPIASAFFGEPSEQLQVLAVTGTNGKTSTAWWLAQALSYLKQVAPIRCGLVGTLGIGFPPAPGAAAGEEGGAPKNAAEPGTWVATGLTTPDPVLLQQTFRRFVTQGVQACAIEVSSIGIEEHRMDGTRIHTAIFTNFTQDHLDYHGTMDAYWQAKARLFQWAGLKAAVINVDDVQGAALAAELSGRGLDLWTVSCSQTARLQACDIRHGAPGLWFRVQEAGATGVAPVLQTRLIGAYNVANLLGVIATLRVLGVPLNAAVASCADLTPVPGRMEFVGAAGQPLAAVDYAHTPDALGQALQALRPLAAERGGQLWCVFGCGGNRDAAKRPLMGAMAARHADRVVVTSDNPRNEKPELINSQILLGLSGHAQVVVEPDRAQAIAYALEAAAAQDVLLIAGKGHEDYQEVAGQRLPFSDLAQLHEALGHWRAAPSTAAPPGASMPDALPMTTLQQAAAWLPNARLVDADGAGGTTRFGRVHTDTRTLEPGDLFVALRGERFDGNDFLIEARQRGAVAAICQGDADAHLQAAGLPGLVVPDAKLALAALATAWRAQFGLPLIAVTGSNGKTTVTQMLAAILRAFKPHACLATQGNLNNDIGVPLTVLRLRAAHEVAVIELGMNHPGEIATLAAIARPTVALVNNAQREHLEFMGTVDAVAEENGSVIDALPVHGVAVFPSDDAFSALWATKTGARATLTFSADAAHPANVSCVSAQWSGDAWQVVVNSPAGPMDYTLRIAGRHNVKNSLAAVACALAAGVPVASIVRGLNAFEPVKGRSKALQVSVAGRVITLVDDTYNANPDSVQAAIDVLASLPGPRLLVLGDMGEVGHDGSAFHAQAGHHAHAQGIEVVFTLGILSAATSQAFGSAGRHFADMTALQAAVLAALPHIGSIVVKGSRFMKMEQVVQAIVQYEQDNKGMAAC